MNELQQKLRKRGKAGEKAIERARERKSESARESENENNKYIEGALCWYFHESDTVIWQN